MKYQLSSDSVFPLVEVELTTADAMLIERGSMVYQNESIELVGEMNSNGDKGVMGALKAMGRSTTSGESFFITKVTSQTDHGKIAIAPATPGKIREIQVGETQWLLNTGVFLACDDSVSYTMKRQKLGKAMLAGTGGFYIMETHGEGMMLVNSYGDIVEIDLDGSEPISIDNLHVIAWTNTLDYNIKVASGTFGFKTGEGLVNEFHGKGKILIQTRNLQALAANLAMGGSGS
ncbi:uncharacterized protein (TIGR00266 family) [Enterococcus sp. PF1-24]|uniref:TIGR00266 family protein n=1 Tax=unclassified Enterococcus TaxID=2608891 RepID=UPI002474D1AF|nr:MULTISPECIES: TIGR00266 family protein [unclassified Enterococcus]MDH6363727.1 uncharacterized protein (TIGR00266 family) [Enterococcus sp. PFB1-1]MDH6400683.1 uncharacterized protein (TIGR00266 family) [Enterococcus sp. PF1-24]